MNVNVSKLGTESVRLLVQTTAEFVVVDIGETQAYLVPADAVHLWRVLEGERMGAGAPMADRSSVPGHFLNVIYKDPYWVVESEEKQLAELNCDEALALAWALKDAVAQIVRGLP
jgi:hypothetical protein